MDATATPSPELVAILSTPDRPLRETAIAYERALESLLRDERAKGGGGETVFQQSLRLKNKLDELENYGEGGRQTKYFFAPLLERLWSQLLFSFLLKWIALGRRRKRLTGRCAGHGMNRSGGCRRS